MCVGRPIRRNAERNIGYASAERSAAALRAATFGTGGGLRYRACPFFGKPVAAIRPAIVAADADRIRGILWAAVGGRAGDERSALSPLFVSGGGNVAFRYGWYRYTVVGRSRRKAGEDEQAGVAETVPVGGFGAAVVGSVGCGRGRKRLRTSPLVSVRCIGRADTRKGGVS